MQNHDLLSRLQDLPGRTFFEVFPSLPRTLLVPTEVPPGSAVVLVYEVTAPGTQAGAIDFVQFVTPLSGDVNGDGCVNDLDLEEVLLNFGRGC